MLECQNEFDEFKKFMKDIKLSKVNGFENKIYNEIGNEIASTVSPHYAEGIVKSHNNFMVSIVLFEEIIKLTDDELIRDKIEKYLRNCIG